MPSCSSFGNCTSLRRAGNEIPYFGFRFPSAASCVTPQARPAPSRALGKAVNNRSAAAATTESTPLCRAVRTRTRIFFRQTGNRHYDCGRQSQGD